MCRYPTIDPAATGRNITRLRRERGLSVKQLQAFFGFEDPQAIYKWQWGKSLPSVDNLYALSMLLNVPMNEILVPTRPDIICAPQDGSRGAHSFFGRTLQMRRSIKAVQTISIVVSLPSPMGWGKGRPS